MVSTALTITEIVSDKSSDNPQLLSTIGYNTFMFFLPQNIFHKTHAKSLSISSH